MKIIALFLILISFGWMSGLTKAEPAQTHNAVNAMEDLPMMKAYRENQIDDFKILVAQVDHDSLIDALEIAMDEQRTDFIEVILDAMPKNWNADEIAEKKVQEHSVHGLQYVLVYTTPEKHAEWLSIAIMNGDADLAALLYENMHGTDSTALAAQVYANIKATGNRLSKARHIEVFEVFRPFLDAGVLSEYYDQAMNDNETDFAAYLSQQIEK